MILMHGARGRGARPSPQPGPEIRNYSLPRHLERRGRGEGRSIRARRQALEHTTTCEWFAGGFSSFAAARKTGPRENRSFLNIPWIRRQDKSYAGDQDQQASATANTTGGTIEDSRKTFIVDIDAGGKPGQVRVHGATWNCRPCSPIAPKYPSMAAVDGDHRKASRGRIRPARIDRPIAAQTTSATAYHLPMRLPSFSCVNDRDLLAVSSPRV